MGTEDIYNYRRVSDTVITGGHPSEEQLRAAAEEGFRAVVNLAPVDDRAVPNEDALVQSLGMAYHYLPVDWEYPTAVDFAAFEEAMKAVGGERVLIHCAANFRVTAFYSLYAQKHLGWSGDEAAALRASIWDGSDIPVWRDAFAPSKQPCNQWRAGASPSTGCPRRVPRSSWCCSRTRVSARTPSVHRRSSPMPRRGEALDTLAMSKIETTRPAMTPALPNTLRLGAVDLTVADLDRAVAWYERSLGLRVHTHDSDVAELGDGAQTVVVLHEDPDARPAARYGRPLPLRAAVPEARGARPRRSPVDADPHPDPGRVGSRHA